MLLASSLSASLLCSPAIRTSSAQLYWIESVAYASPADSVTFSVEEVDSILAVLDSSETTIRLLRVDLGECRELGRVDSLAAAAALADEHQAWYERLAKHPLVWFVIGALTAAQIGEMAR